MNRKKLRICWEFLIIQLVFVALFVAVSPVPRRIIPVSMTDFDWRGLLKRLIYFIVYWEFLLYWFCSLDWEQQKKRRASLKAGVLSVLLTIQVAIESVSLLFSNSMLTVMIYCDVALIFQWIAVLVFLSKRYNEQTRHADMKSMLIIGVAIIVACAYAIIKDCETANSVALVQTRFLPDSTAFETRIRLVLAAANVRRATMEVFLPFVLVHLFLPAGGQSELMSRRWFWNRRFAQAMFCVCFAFFYFLLNLIVYPRECVIRVSHEQSFASANEMKIYLHNLTVVRYPDVENPQKKDSLYTRCVIESKGKKTANFLVAGKRYAFRMGEKNGVRHGNLVLVRTDNREASAVFSDDIVAFSTNNMTVVTTAAEFGQLPYFAELVHICEKMNEGNNYTLFPFYAAYLTRWDASYIQPHLVECVAMSLDMRQTIEAEGIKPEYIQQCALELLDQLAGRGDALRVR